MLSLTQHLYKLKCQLVQDSRVKPANDIIAKSENDIIAKPENDGWLFTGMTPVLLHLQIKPSPDCRWPKATGTK